MREEVEAVTKSRDDRDACKHKMADVGFFTVGFFCKRVSKI